MSLQRAASTAPVAGDPLCEIVGYVSNFELGISGIPQHFVLMTEAQG